MWGGRILRFLFADSLCMSNAANHSSRRAGVEWRNELQMGNSHGSKLKSYKRSENFRFSFLSNQQIPDSWLNQSGFCGSCADEDGSWNNLWCLAIFTSKINTASSLCMRVPNGAHLLCSPTVVLNILLAYSKWLLDCEGVHSGARNSLWCFTNEPF